MAVLGLLLLAKVWEGVDFSFRVKGAGTVFNPEKDGKMDRCRKYGVPPYGVAVVHGGPGAAGSVAEVARELSRVRGTLEPIQTAVTLAGQIEELARTLQNLGSPPLTLIGHSWGAWLSWLLAADHPHLVARLILVSAGPFEERYAAAITQTRLAQLSPAEAEEYGRLIAAVEGGLDGGEGEAALQRLGVLAEKADGFEPLAPQPPWPAEASAAESRRIYAGVWPQAARLRQSGELLARAELIRCPVLAIHGRCDSHPAEGVAIPLADRLANFRMVVLPRCGHAPWRERYGRDEFFRLLEAEILNRPLPDSLAQAR